jgi:TRAP-type transport system small permease protein
MERGILRQIFDRLLLLLAVAAAVVLGFIMFSIDLEVLLRYSLGSPTSWVVDMSEYGLLCLLFLAAPWVLLHDSHVKIDILLHFCSPHVRRRLNLLASLIGAAACAIFCYFAIIVVWDTFQASEMLWRSIIVPKWMVWVVMPIGSLLLTLQFLRRARLYLKEQGTSNKPRQD